MVPSWYEKGCGHAMEKRIREDRRELKKEGVHQVQLTLIERGDELEGNQIAFVFS